jgi:hypothetical protein
VHGDRGQTKFLRLYEYGNDNEYHPSHSGNRRALNYVTLRVDELLCRASYHNAWYFVSIATVQ